MDPTELVDLIFSSPLVDDALCHEKLGGSKQDTATALLYLQLPVRARPQISHLFDQKYYIERNLDIEASGTDPLIHFIEHGCYESRFPHPLINFHYIRNADPYLLPATCNSSELYEILRYNLVDPSPYFSGDYYQAQAPDVLESGYLEHFLRLGLKSGLWPNPFLDPLWYYRQLDGIHDVWSGLRHFVSVGDAQGRASSPGFDGALYLERYPDVATAGMLPLVHYLGPGIREGRSSFPIRDRSTASALLRHSGPAGSAAELGQDALVASYQTMRQRVASRRQDEKNNVFVRLMDIVHFDDPLCHLTELALPRHDTPRVSIMIPSYNETQYTAECIGSIVKSNPQVAYEVIVADDASPDPSAAAIGQIENVKFIRQPSNMGFLRNCNTAFALCTGEYLLLLNNDAQLMPGALDYLVEVLDREADVAAVGPKMLYPDGRLQEAGCTIDRDGVTKMVGLFADPARPSFNYDRDVHYCSGAALLLRRSALDDILFDETFMPAYCEDTDLCLRLLSKGYRVVYCHKAEIVHHLSVSTNKQSVTRRLQLVARNQQKLARKWAALLEDMSKVRPIAFYLPQYHPTPENDYYWGKGFTEWTNVTKACPAYVDHYQPHLPADLGFYDLRVKQTMEAQAALARRYGIAGFCVYYYNFGPTRALDGPFEAMVADPTIDFPYCVCWANENWTRHWDGGSKEPIFEQKYDLETFRGVIADATRYAADPRYIRVNDKPLFLVYRPLLIPDVQGFARMVRQGFLDAGFDQVHLVYVESMETASSVTPPSDIGFDGCVEFPPQGLAVKLANQTNNIVEDNFAGIRYDYEATVIESVSREPVGYSRYPCAFPSWDNTPRQPLRGDSFVGATPEAFQVYVEEKLTEAAQQFVGDERLLFINAWNEWAEGTHLEPDRRFGHRWLEAVRNALMNKSLG